MNCYPFIEAEKAQGCNVKRACGLLKVSTPRDDRTSAKGTEGHGVRGSGNLGGRALVDNRGPPSTTVPVCYMRAFFLPAGVR